MSALTAMGGGGLCRDRSALFDSTAPDAHAEAKSLCAQCPVFAACFEALTEARRASAYACPEGTWAGQLLVGQKAERARFKAWRAAS